MRFSPSFDSFCPLWYNYRLISLFRTRSLLSKDPMTTFHELLAPVMPIIQQIEHDRPKHHNEDLTWSDFIRILVYFFTNNRTSGNELIVALQAADPDLSLPKTSRRALSEGFWRFSPKLLQQTLTA